MKREMLIEVYHEESNFAVMKAPGRKYPGALIQGDSLGRIVGELAEAIELFESDKEESLGCLENAFEQLKWRLDLYSKVSKENQIT